MSSPLSISIFGPSSSPVLSHPVPKASSLIPFSPFATDRLSVPEAVTERFHPTSLWYYYIRALMRVLLLFHIPSLSSSSPFRYIEGPPPRLSRLSADFRPPSLPPFGRRPAVIQNPSLASHLRRHLSISPFSGPFTTFSPCLPLFPRRVGGRTKGALRDDLAVQYFFYPHSENDCLRTSDELLYGHRCRTRSKFGTPPLRQRASTAALTQ